MFYISTRGVQNAPNSSDSHASQQDKKTFTEILLGGLAPDGGLYLPETYPQVSRAELAAWRTLSYADLATEILSKFIDDIPLADLKTIVYKTYRADVFKNGRNPAQSAEIAPLHVLEPGFALLELSNGPTLAFKDMAMQLLGNLFEYVLDKQKREINILGATSGDTGSAAEYALCGKKGLRVFMLSPHGKMSAFQRAQMYSLDDRNIFNIAVEGLFDDAQDIVKAVSNDLAFKEKHKIGAVNSINWARVVAQIVYYFKGYFAATKTADERVDFAVPSGNFGNICAGHIARMMGLPIEQLVLATNENNVLDEFFKTGLYRPRAAAETHITSSPSMDISKASNFERFVFDLVGRDPAVIRSLWANVDQGRAFDLSKTADNTVAYFSRLPAFGIVSGNSTHADRLATIRQTYQKYSIMVDTHTADALKVAAEKRVASRTMIVLETALPAKFEESIIEALGKKPDRPVSMKDIENAPQHVHVMPVDVNAVKAFIVERT